VEKEIRNVAKIRDVVVEVGKTGIMINNILGLRGLLSGYSHLTGQGADIKTVCLAALASAA